MGDMVFLNNAELHDAMLWFLRKEKYRHEQDIIDIDRDIGHLIKLGAKDVIDPINTFIHVNDLYMFKEGE